MKGYKVRRIVERIRFHCPMLIKKYAHDYHKLDRFVKVYHFMSVNWDFLGIMSSMQGSSFGNVSRIFDLIDLWTEVLTFCLLAMSSLALNFLNICGSVLNMKVGYQRGCSPHSNLGMTEPRHPGCLLRRPDSTMKEWNFGKTALWSVWSTFNWNCLNWNLE